MALLAVAQEAPISTETPISVDVVQEVPKPEVRGHIDWQGHPAMHIPWTFFQKGLTAKTPKMSYRHQFRQVVFEPYLRESGVRIFLVAAIAEEKARNPKQARKLILQQIAYINDFVAAHPEHYALAKTPEEAREIIATTDKMVLIHSIEGAHLLLEHPEDAQFWADQGVALMTLIHLRDDELGGAALLPGTLGRLVNPRGAKHLRRNERRGLTPRGKAAIVELADAGILVDFSHMTRDSRADALAVTAENGIPPLLTHGSLASIRDTDWAITEAQLVEVYAQGGIFAMGLSGPKLVPDRPQIPIPDHCVGSIDSWAFHYQRATQVLEAHVGEVFGDPTLTVDSLTEAQRTALSVGWSSDWNGFLSHSEPKYGRGRCKPLSELTDPLPIDTLGLAHPGMLPQQWKRLEEAGVDLDPTQRSAERFLQLWEQVLAR